MKRRSLISILFVGVLALAFLLGVTVIGTGAEGTVKLYTVGDLGVEGATVVDSIQDALQDLQGGSRQWSTSTTAEIQIKGNDHGGGYVFINGAPKPFGNFCDAWLHRLLPF